MPEFFGHKNQVKCVVTTTLGLLARYYAPKAYRGFETLRRQLRITGPDGNRSCDCPFGRRCPSIGQQVEAGKESVWNLRLGVEI